MPLRDSGAKRGQIFNDATDWEGKSRIPPWLNYELDIFDSVVAKTGGLPSASTQVTIAVKVIPIGGYNYWMKGTSKQIDVKVP
jgi:hypothetical protein